MDCNAEMQNTIIKEKVAEYREELLERLGMLVAINSEEGEAKDGMPFGEGPARALECALEMLKKDGFETVNLDNYAGYAQIGEGEQLIGVVGHLDIVPAALSDGWDSDPFTMVEKDGCVFGRGVADDKGAVVASMVALKVLRDLNVPLNKRIRLIMGTNEETGSKCLQYYVEKEGHVDYGFTPDGDFPGIYGEKGMIKAHYTSKQTRILGIQGGAAGNIVCGKVGITLPADSLDEDKLSAFFADNQITFELEKKETTWKITVYGIAAHASTPTLGVNAIGYLMKGLETAGFEDSFVAFFNERFGLATDGEGIGAKCSDSYGNLTLNCGTIRMEDGVITGSLDIRCPVTMKPEEIVAQMAPYMDDERGKIHVDGVVQPLFVDPNSPLVVSLAKAYEDVTGDTETKPCTIGGGTYAKKMNNTIAFGCALPDKDYRIHNTNEWVPIDELLMQAEIYVHAILNLLEQ